MNVRENPLSETDARQIAWEFRQKFRNSEAFEAAWTRLFELRTAVTPHLARRFLGEEFVKYRARLVGLEEPPTNVSPMPSRPAEIDTYCCPGCERDLPEWSRHGHADDCRNVGCYGLEVRFREAKRRQAAAKQQVAAAPEAPPEPAVEA